MPGTEGRKANSPRKDGGAPQAVSRSERRERARRTAEVMRTLQRITGSRPQPDSFTTRELAKGHVTWPEVRMVRVAVLEAARAAVDRWDANAAATLTGFLRADAPDPEVGRLTALVAMLSGDAEAAEQQFYQSSRGTGSVSRRRTNAHRTVEELQQFLDFRTNLSATRPPPSWPTCASSPRPSPSRSGRTPTPRSGATSSPASPSASRGRWPTSWTSSPRPVAWSR